MDKRFTILIVDDDAVNLRSITFALRDEYDILTAVNGYDAIRQIKEHFPDLVLLDVMMPDLSGFDVCSIIKSDAAFADIPFIFLTALDTRSGEFRGLEVGAIDYLTKPIDFSLLKLRVRNHLELKQRNEIIREQRNLLERHRTVFQSAVDGIWWVDTQGRLIEVNDAYSRMSGYTVEELIAMSISDLEVIESASDTAAHMQKIIAEGHDRFESRHRRKDGSVFDVELSVQYLPVGTIQVVAFSRDITERKRMVAALQESEERFRTLMENIPSVAVQGYALDGTVRFWNRASEQLYGFSAGEALGANLLDLIIPAEMRDGVASAIQRMKESGEPIPASEMVLQHKDGSPVPVFSSHALIFPTSQQPELFCLDIDMSLQKRAELENQQLQQQLQQAQKLESLGVLAGGIAHDFNNILAIIIGNCFMAKMHPDKAEHNITTIEKASERAAELCRQMLAYAGKTQYIESHVNFGALVDEMVKMLKATISQNVLINLHYSADTPAIVADASQLRQIVMNLIINAAEAIGEAQGEILVTLTKATIKVEGTEKDHLGKIIPAGKYVCLEVTDDGCGMDDETQKRLFEPFYTTKFTGRGLGMSAVLGIITGHNGALQLCSQPGFGTTFKVYLPVKGSEASEEESPDHFASVAWRGSGTILLVEDEEQIRVIVRTMLAALEFSVIEAAHGKEALELYHRHADEITLVITDIGMPIMDGYELFNELKKLKPELPIIISSGFGENVITARIEQADIAGLMIKPYTFEQLGNVLKSVLEE